MNKNDRVAADILGWPVVEAMGGIKDIKRRTPTQEEQDAVGSDLKMGDWIVFVPHD